LAADNEGVGLALRRSPLAVVPVLGVGWLALTASNTGDYVTYGPVSGDNPGPAIIDLVHGNFAGFAAHRPLMGLASIVLRVPFVALAQLLGGGNLLTYRLGVLACLLPLAFAAAWLALPLWRSSSGRLISIAAVALLLFGPATLDAVRSGHPEEPLAAVLIAGAVVCASRGAAGWSGALLGLAIGTKQWALLAIPPVLFALPDGGRRLRGLLVAALISVPLALLPLVLGSDGIASAVRAVGESHLTNPLSLWWPFSSPLRLSSGGLAPAHLMPLGLTRKVASELVTIALLGCSGACALWARRRRAAVDPLALLALLAVVRCAFDPLPLEYYSLAWFVPLVVWEAHSRRRLPVAALLGAVWIAVVEGDPLRLSSTPMSLASIAFTVALGGYLLPPACGLSWPSLKRRRAMPALTAARPLPAEVR
jgi:hypothetical protein